MIGVAIVGLGNALAPQARAVQDLADRVRVVHAVARNSAQRRAVAELYGFFTSDDTAAAIADPRVDAVMILTPTNAHLEIAEAAFAAGKHVLCEKPLETTVARAERLVACGRRADRRLAVMLQLRFRAASRRLKALLEADALGEIQAATMTVPWWRPQSYYDQPGRGVKSRDGGGVLMIQAIHTLDLFRWCVGISAVEAAIVRTTSLHRMETEDYATALVRLGSPWQRCSGFHRRDGCRFPGWSGTNRGDRDEGHCQDGRQQPDCVVPGRNRRRGSGWRRVRQRLWLHGFLA